MSEVIAELDLIGGSVNYDARAAIRATCDLTVAGDEWVPEVASDPLAPYGNEIRVSRGVKYGDGTEELVSLGIFRIEEVEAVDSGDGGLEVRISGSDRASAVSDAKFEQPLNAGRSPFLELIENVVVDAIGPVVTDFRFDPGPVLTPPPLMAEEAEDRWEFVQGLATALGCELFFGDNGELILQQVPEVNKTSMPVAEIVEGEGGVLLEASNRWSRIDAFNKVTVSVEGSSVVPVSAYAQDNNPDSPTLYDGPFGKVPRWYSNQYITTKAQAQDAADGILIAELGVTQQIDFGAVVNPTLRVSDVVAIRRAKLGIAEAHIIDSLTIPLDAESSMTGTTRLTYPLALGTTDPPDLPEHLLYSPETLYSDTQVYF